MRSRSDDVDPALAVDRALAGGVVGMGAATDEQAARRLARFCAAAVGSFVWTRRAEDLHLGRLTGPCERDDDAGAVPADLVHVRPCDWLPEPVDVALVPDQVRHAFTRGGRNLQRIGRPGVALATARVWTLIS